MNNEKMFPGSTSTKVPAFIDCDLDVKVERLHRETLSQRQSMQYYDREISRLRQEIMYLKSHKHVDGIVCVDINAKDNSCSAISGSIMSVDYLK